MHGTPEMGLFSRARRDLSHGCIRVENPAELAAWVLRDDPAWALPQVIAAMHGEDSISVKLPHFVTILILYGTAVVEEDGEIRFFNDIYGLDTALQTSIDQRHKQPPDARPHSSVPVLHALVPIWVDFRPRPS